MGFIEDIKAGLGLDFSSEGFRVTLSDNAGYFENVKSVKYYKCEEIGLSLKKGEIKIYGENLVIKKFCMGDVVVCGKIIKIERI